MEFKHGNLTFSSNFDSGNLLNVERIIYTDENCANQSSDSNKPDYEFHVWTAPDSYGTEFENGNRTWFHFSVKGYNPNKLIKITIKNLNRQQRLYSQGYCPLFRTESQYSENKWLRVRFRPTWETNENNFQLTFMHRFSEYKNSVTYFAFCYPWSYGDCQKQLDELDIRLPLLRSYSWEKLSTMDPKSIYYHRELLTNSLDKRRVDLLTITDLHGLENEREEIFDEKLFPVSCNRPWKFFNKKVFVVTSRVHPGETPSSHVFNGFLEFILRKDDVRSMKLRKNFVFKLIPLLNPDGVYRGHYRTDTRGVNLNRVYLYPDFKLHPSIYAAKSLLVYHHICNSTMPSENINNMKTSVFKSMKHRFSETPASGLMSPPLSKNGFFSLSNDQLGMSNFNDSKEFEISSSEDGLNEIIGTHLKLQNDHILPPLQMCANRDLNNDINFMKDYLEVLVDVGNHQNDILVNSRCENTSNESEFVSNNCDEIICETKDPSVQSMNNLAISDNTIKSLYKLSKLSPKPQESLSKSIESNEKPATEHHWNLRNFQLTSPTNNLKQIVKSHKKISNSMIPLPLRPAIVSMKFASKKINKIAINSAQLSKMKKELQMRNGYQSESKIGNEGSDEDSDKDCINFDTLLKCSEHLSDPILLNIPQDKSGIAFYVDLHGHCSKRGCFIYGNCLDSENEMIANILYPKLISLNSAHFDFAGCNFSFKNMYTRDKRDGSSKEGAGRVAIWKHLGIVHSYTLECNYNTGRIVNAIAQLKKDDGKTSPPSSENSSLLAPRYTPHHFEDVGKAMAISALDILSINPLSRIVNSEYNNLQNLYDYLKKYLSNQKLGIRSSYPFKNKITKLNKTQPSNSSISSNSKAYPISSDNRRNNYSQNSISLSGSRKSQSSHIHRLPNQKLPSNQKLTTKPVFSNEVILNAYQLDILLKDENLEFNKTNMSPIINNENEVGKSKDLNSNINCSANSSDNCIRSDNCKPFVKKSTIQNEKISCDSSTILFRNFHPETNLQNNLYRKSKENDYCVQIYNNNIPKLHNHIENKSLLPLRRNSIANCYLQNFIEKEKTDKLNEILSEEQPNDKIQSCCKAYSFNYGKKTHSVRKKDVKNKNLGKLISYSANDIHY